MFTKIVINLSGPICTCNKGNLAWRIDAGPALVMFCKTCNVHLIIPKEQFLAEWNLNTGYPDGWLLVSENKSEDKTKDSEKIESDKLN